MKKYYFPLSFLFLVIIYFGVPGFCSKSNDFKLLQAATEGNLVEVKNLIDAGANPDTSDSSGMGVLHRLCSSYFIEDSKSESSIILFMVLHNANLNMRDKEGNSPLFYAIQSGNLEAVKGLLNHGTRVNIRNKKMQTPLFYAVSFIIAGAEEINSINFVKTLYEAGGDINALDIDQKNLLHYSKNPTVTAWLINHGVNFKHRDNYGKTPFDYSREDILKARDAIITATQNRKI